jgi:hypothetical protein
MSTMSVLKPMARTKEERDCMAFRFHMARTPN